MNPLANALEQFIRQEFLFDSPETKLSADTPLIDAGIIDSLGILTLIGFLEKEQGLKVGPEDIVFENFETMDAILRFADTLRG